MDLGMLRSPFVVGSEIRECVCCGFGEGHMTNFPRQVWPSFRQPNRSEISRFGRREFHALGDVVFVDCYLQIVRIRLWCHSGGCDGIVFVLCTANVQCYAVSLLRMRLQRGTTSSALCV